MCVCMQANNVAAYVTGLVRGATKNLVIDMGECTQHGACSMQRH